MGTTATNIRVRRGYCPISKRIEHSVWDGGRPSIPAVTFLRAQFDNEEETVACKAYALANFLKWLRAHQLEFWKIEYADIQDYKLSLLAEARVGQLSYPTAKKYLKVVYDLCVYWQAPSARQPVLFTRESSYGVLSHLKHLRRRLPKEFVIVVPKSKRGNSPGDKGLSLDFYEAVWSHLERIRPERPPILDLQLRTAAEFKRQQEAQRSYDFRRMLFYRNKAIWAFMLASGVRIGELTRVRTEDIVNIADRRYPNDPPRLYLSLKDRAVDAHLGKLKTGHGKVFIGHTRRYLLHLQEWQTYGTLVAEDRRRVKGLPEHCMLFSRGDGGPLRQSTVRRLFRKIDEAVQITRRMGTDGISVPTGVTFSPQTTRHTITSIFRSNGVPVAFQQRFLRHKRPQTTDLYGQVFERQFVQALEGYFKLLDQEGRGC